MRLGYAGGVYVTTFSTIPPLGIGVEAGIIDRISITVRVRVRVKVWITDRIPIEVTVLVQSNNTI